MIAYKCVVVATRPLLLSILKERLERLGQREDDWQSFLAPTKVLISTGIKSALKTLQILTDENSLLGKLFFFFFIPSAYISSSCPLLCTAGRQANGRTTT
jgi:hypothetical protein